MKYNLTTFGKYMYCLIDRYSYYLYKHKWLYYLLNYTWGILMTTVGLFITLGLLIIGKKPKRFERIYYFEVYEYWGGFEMGQMFVRDKTSTKEVSYHEYGHTFQNAILGPLYPFLVGIPSVTRYWYRTILENKNYDKYIELIKVKPYDAIWFEASATDVGTKYSSK